MNTTKIWIDAMADLRLHGRLVGPRDLTTKELLFKGATFDMNEPVIYHQDRKLNYTFMAAEALFIANGDNRVENLVPYNKNMAQFSDDGLIFNGSYGPPFNNQLMYVVNTLARDINTRQAVMTIWKQNPVASADIRCTIALQFIVRNGKMHTKVNMRSSDCWLGVPYDWFNFTIMTLRVLTLLNRQINSRISLGNMRWEATSFHAYENNWPAIDKVLNSEPNKVIDPMPERCYCNWQYVVDSLHACIEKQDTGDLWKIRP